MIRDGDTKAEVLYKMNEHLHNIIYPVNGILENEETLRRFISRNQDQPDQVQSFEEKPKAIEDESNFVQTIDYQLVKVQEMFLETVQKAFDI